MSFWKKISEIGGPTGSKEWPDTATVPAGDVGQRQGASASSSAGAPPSAKPAGTLSTPTVVGDVEEVLAARFGKTRSALGSGTVIQGKLSFDTPVRIDGKLSGEVYSSKALIVGPTGQIDAQLDVQSLIVLGMVRGVIKATERVEILGDGEIDGNISTPVLVIAEGCKFTGACKMPQTPQAHSGLSGGGSARMEELKASTSKPADRASLSVKPATDSGVKVSVERTAGNAASSTAKDEESKPINLTQSV